MPNGLPPLPSLPCCHIPLQCFMFFFSFPSLNPADVSSFRPLFMPDLENEGRLWDSPTMSSRTSVKSFVRHSFHAIRHAIMQKTSLIGVPISIPPDFHRSWAWARSAPRSRGRSSPWTWSMQWKVSNAAYRTIISGWCVCVCVQGSEDKSDKLIEC